MRSLLAIPVGLLLSIGSCKSPVQQVCAGPFKAVIATVVSSVDGSPVIEGLSATLEDGSYFEVLRPNENLLPGAQDRPGIYTIDRFRHGF